MKKEIIKDKLRKAFSIKNLLIGVIDVIISIVVIFTFFGEEIIGYNISGIYFFAVLFVYMTYIIYKSICRLQDFIEEKKSSS